MTHSLTMEKLESLEPAVNILWALFRHFVMFLKTFFVVWNVRYQDWHVPNTVTWAVSLSLSPTMLVPTQMYMPASLFLVLEIISFPPRI